MNDHELRQDICAAVAILLQTGGVIVDANPPEGHGENDPIPMAHLGSRR